MRLPLRLLLPAIALAFLLPAVPLSPATEDGGIPQIPCQTVAGVERCPDLIVQPAKLAVNFVEERTFTSTSCDVVEGMSTAGTHQLLRFYFTTPNIGLGDLVVGRPADHPEWFVYSSCHNHYHFREYADYRLWEPAMFLQWQVARASMAGATPAEVLAAHPELTFASGEKRGFCVIDINFLGMVPIPGRYLSCSGNQGISVGWADEYSPGLAGQYVTIDGVPPGPYILEAEVNAERLYKEISYDNNAAFVPVNIL